jgi:hypothetical protein
MKRDETMQPIRSNLSLRNNRSNLCNLHQINQRISTHTDGRAGDGGETLNTSGKSRGGNSDHRELHLGGVF